MEQQAYLEDIKDYHCHAILPGAVELFLGDGEKHLHGSNFCYVDIVVRHQLLVRKLHDSRVDGNRSDPDRSSPQTLHLAEKLGSSTDLSRHRPQL